MARIFPAPIIGQSAASGTQVIDGSLKFEDTPKHHLLRTHTAGNTKTFTWAGWVKRDKYGGYQTLFGHVSGGSGQHYIDFGSDKIRFTRYVSSNEAALETTAKFRDTGWYHIVAIWDTTNSTANDRLRIYVNGEQITDFSTRVNPSQNYSGVINTAIEHGICRIPTLNQNYNACRMSQVYFMDGLALEPENFGFTDPLTNTWKPKKYTGDFNGPADLKSEDGTFTATGDQVGGPIANAYDGNTGTPDGSTSGVTFWGRSGGTATQSGLSIPIGSTVRIYYNVNVAGGTITVNSVSRNANVPGGGNTSIEILDWTSGEVGSTLTSISIYSPNLGVGVYVSAILVDGVVLEDIPAGTNGFYLPMDGNSPIGKDNSGNGNDWTPTNFGGSVALDNPNVSGAKPILNTLPGGTQAGVGVFGSKENIVYTVTVSNPGSGNKYYLDGVEAPTLSNLIRGVTYTFDQSDSSNSTHPLVFGSTAEGNNFARGALYGSISAGTAGAATTITIPYDAPETLYYHCSAHSGMGGSIVGIHTDETKADQYASNCILALPLIGSTGDVSASIACTSSTKAITNNNATASNLRSNFYSGSFDFDSSADLRTASLADFAYGTGDFTWEAWFYHDTSNTNQYIIDHGNNYGTILYNSSGQIAYYVDSSQNASFGTIAQDKWHHVAVCRSSGVTNGFLDGVKTQLSANDTSNFGTAPVVVTIGEHGPGSYNWEGNIQDVRIYRGVAKYTTDFVVPSRSPDILPDTPSGVSGSSKLAKITDGAIALDGNGDYLSLADSADFDFGTGDYTAEAFVYARSHADMYVINQTTDHGGVAPWWGLNVWSNGSSFTIRAGRTDGSGNAKHEFSFPWAINKWYHFAVSRSSGTSRLYFDGRLLDTQSDTDDIDGNGTLYIGAYNNGGLNWNGFISNVRIIKGTGLYTKAKITPPTAPLTNVTNTKLLCCQSNTSAIEGAVKPGTITANGDATATNFNPFNTDINTVRGQETGYCTWNPLNKGDDITLSNGNLQAATTSSPKDGVFGTIGVSSGKFYWEVKLLNATGNTNAAIGVARDILSPDAGTPTSAGAYFYSSYNGNKWLNDTDSSYGDSYAASDTIGVALDLDNTTLTFFKNGVSQGDATTSLPSETFFPYVGDNANNASQTVLANWGQKPFKFPPPDGFQPLNTANTRPETVISRPDKFVGTILYTGNSSSQRVGGLNMSPDFVWLKSRSHTYDHYLTDTVRGATKSLRSNTTAAEDTLTQGLTSFNSDGFSVGNEGQFNNTGRTMVAWCWRAGGSKNTFNVDDVGYATAAAAGMSDGTMTVTGSSVGTKQGFSILTYTGTNSNESIPHGLDSAPSFYIVKARENSAYTDFWSVYHQSLGKDAYIKLNSTDAASTSSNIWNNTAPTDSLFYVRSDSIANENGIDYVAYLWHDVPGLQKFGSYESNNSTDGPYVELGFRPALLWVKEHGAAGQSWHIIDKERDVINPVYRYLYTNATNVEGGSAAGTGVDFLSNGFKIRNNDNAYNASSSSFIYCAWAEAPSVDLYGGGANAR